MTFFSPYFHYFYILHLKKSLIYHIIMTSGHASLESPKTPANMPESPNRPPLHPSRALGVPTGNPMRYEKHRIHVHVLPETPFEYHTRIQGMLVHVQVFRNLWPSARRARTVNNCVQVEFIINRARLETRVLPIPLHSDVKTQMSIDLPHQ
jgi:hypothetical protein